MKDINYALPYLQDNNVKNNQKIITCLKKVSSLNANSSNNIGRPKLLNAKCVKYAPIFRSVLGQGEINSKFSLAIL